MVKSLATEVFCFASVVGKPTVKSVMPAVFFFVM